MDQFQVGDNYDNQNPIIISPRKLLNASFKPKFITELNETQHQRLSQFKKWKKTQSYQVLKSIDKCRESFQDIQKCDDFDKKQHEYEKIVKQSIELIKKTTVYECKPINILSLFQKAERMYDISLPNHKIIRFVEISDQNNIILVQKTNWNYFATFQGKGIMILPDDRRIKGYWSNSCPLGKVSITYPNQSIYYGDVNAQLQKDGAGYIYFKNGQKMQGKFSSGKLQGSAIYYDKSGQAKNNYKFNNGLLISSARASKKKSL